MKSTDWKFDFSLLPRWDNRERIPFVYDEFFEIPQQNLLCCIYSVCEVSMCNPLGFLAVLRNKEKPELIVNITDNFVFCPQVSASLDGNLIFLWPSIYDKKTDYFARPLLILDLGNNRFSYFITHNFSPCCEIIEVDHGTFRIEADDYQRNADKRLEAISKMEIRIDQVNWYDLSQIRKLPKLLQKKTKRWRWFGK